MSNTSQMQASFVGQNDILLAKPVFFIGECTVDRLGNIFFGQGFDFKDLSSTANSRIDRDVRIFGRGADQDDTSFFQMRQEKILFWLS